MTYPLILAPNGQEIMRINHDASTSVRWDAILNHRYEPETELNFVVIRLCEVLLAARDNFVATPWQMSDSWHDKWDHFVCQVDYLSKRTPSHGIIFTVANQEEIIARINGDGTWAMQWSKVEDAARMHPGNAWIVPLVGFSRILVAARDRFRTVPWVALCEADS